MLLSSEAEAKPAGGLVSSKLVLGDCYLFHFLNGPTRGGDQLPIHQQISNKNSRQNLVKEKKKKRATQTVSI